MKQLRLILGDQLNVSHTWFQHTSDEVVYVMMEVRQETDYVRHHIQKVVAFFTAMRAFAGMLTSNGHQVHYLRLDDPQNVQDITGNLEWLIRQYQATSWAFQQPDEFRLDQQLTNFANEQDLPVEIADTEHFFTSRGELAAFFTGKKQLLMESYYRHLRKKHGIMIDPNGQPAGGRWNYDAENRKKWKGKPPVPAVPNMWVEVSGLCDMLHQAGVETFGNIDPQNFSWPIDRTNSLRLLEHFVEHLLPNFGNFQDAMTQSETFLFHSRLSFALNAKILSPQEVVDRSIEAWQCSKGLISISQVEGFVRQILGWREYVRGIYWHHMPAYESMNFFNHTRPLPKWYWTGETRMNCLAHSIRQSLDFAYAHHIQRLMVTGNFRLTGWHRPRCGGCLVSRYIHRCDSVGRAPQYPWYEPICRWGHHGDKTYVSSANYLHKMSDYCGSCTMTER